MFSFHDEFFKTQILSNYQNPERLAICKDKQTSLYIYTARLDEQGYLLHTWIVPDGKYRILEVVMAFPLGKEDIMSRYARQLFPRLPSCP